MTAGLVFLFSTAMISCGRSRAHQTEVFEDGSGFVSWGDDAGVGWLPLGAFACTGAPSHVSAWRFDDALLVGYVPESDCPIGRDCRFHKVDKDTYQADEACFAKSVVWHRNGNSAVLEFDWMLTPRAVKVHEMNYIECGKAAERSVPVRLRFEMHKTFVPET